MRGMQVIPGRDETGKIGEAKLMQWVNSVRHLASREDHGVVSDQMTGAILAHVEEDPEDWIWSHRAVRYVIDELAAPEIGRGTSFPI